MTFLSTLKHERRGSLQGLRYLPATYGTGHGSLSWFVDTFGPVDHHVCFQKPDMGTCPEYIVSSILAPQLPVHFLLHPVTQYIVWVLL